jgi:hypothetical protein
MAAVLPFLAIAGTAVGAAGSLYKGFYQGQVADNNAQIAKQRGDYAVQAGSENAAIASLKGAAEGADIKTAQAANGVDVNTGSAKTVQESHRMASELDVDTILHNASLEKYGYTIEADNLKNEAGLSRTMGVVGAAGDLLTGASGVKWGGDSGGSGVPKIGSWDNARKRVGFMVG